MGFLGKHVVVDGYNLELSQGTGIKTYARTLLHNLKRQGAQTSVLWSFRPQRLPMLQDVMLLERNRPPLKRRHYLVQAVRSLLGVASWARVHQPTGLVMPTHEEAALMRSLDRSYFVANCYDLANHLYRTLRTTLRIRLPEKVDLWHATYPLPLQVEGCPTVTTIHDLIPLKMPWATTDDKRTYYQLIRQTLERSALVMTDSEHSKKDLLDFFPVPPERIQVVYPPLPSGRIDVPPDDLERQLRFYRLRPQSYVLFVSAIQPRKNLGRLCQALASLNCPHKLVVVGARGWLWQEELRSARSLKARGRIVFLDHVPRAQLRALYAGALFFAFPSLYEGFGLPPLEAMAHGCPVLCSNASCLPEVCGDAAVYADPYDVRDLADKIQTLCADEALRERLRQEGHQRIRHFSPEHFRRSLFEAYSRVAA